MLVWHRVSRCLRLACLLFITFLLLPIKLITSPDCYICIGLLVDTHIGHILSHKIGRYGHNPRIWPYGHMALCHYGSEWGRYGYLLKAQYICSNLAKELNWLDYYTRNESKNKILWNFPLYIFPNPFIKKVVSWGTPSTEATQIIVNVV